ncbi:MAG: hypothetical protein JW939_03375 [Candidatus Thermoplasmatota archaeon]|nr:hypothetical protein [Candidatus Thermoplasmatota archaeon]
MIQIGPSEVSVVTAFSMADTYIESNITTEVTWDAFQSPIHVNSTLWITPSGSLTVLPGTEVRFGKNCSLMVNGSLIMGGEGGNTTFRPQSGAQAGSWRGIVLGEGSRSRFERAVIIGANVSIGSDGPSDAVIRNTSISGCNLTFLLDRGSGIDVYNSTLDYSLVKIEDNRSVLRTFALLTGIVVDHMGSPKNSVRFELMDSNGTLLVSHIVNQTGEVPLLLLEGGSFVKDGRNETPGTYEISLSDNPFTHYVNRTLYFNGTSSQNIAFRYTWPPELSSCPESLFIYEDSLFYHYTEVLDRNGVGSVSVQISSPAASYNWDLGRLEFLYANESVLLDIVNITLYDGYDSREYTIKVNVTPMNDPVFVELPSHMVYVREDVPTEMIILLSDEDTPIGDINVSTSDPDNITYIPGSTKLVFLYVDGTPSEFNITLRVSDGSTIREEKLFVYFQAVFYSPFFNGPIDDIVIEEDSSYILDLTDRIDDPDLGEKVTLTVEQDDHSIFSSKVEGRKVFIETLANANGPGRVQLILRDEQGLSVGRTINVTVRPVDDPPVLFYPSVVECGTGEYLFNISYLDIDGDAPDSVTLHLGDARYPMEMSPDDGLDPKIGILFSIKIRLSSGPYDVLFSCRQGEFDVNLSHGSIIVPRTEVMHTLRAYNGSLQVIVWGYGDGILPVLQLFGEGFIPPAGMTYLGCSFRVIPGGLDITKVNINVLPLDLREDIMPISSRLMYLSGNNWTDAGVGFYTYSTGVYSIMLQGDMLNNTLVMFAELDSEYDTDGDGVKNLLDAFPHDPLEWNDTDRDGTGDNSDPDDDGDGFSDDIEVLAGTDPRNPTSYPQDSDEDGILDYLDDDDDGDGLPDEWELTFFLDPLDPSDAMDDPDGDGYSNLDEFLRGSDPTVRERGSEEGGDIPVWIILAIAVVLILLLAGVIGLLVFSRRQGEWEVEERDEEWEIAGELDPDEAVECLECGEVYPLWFEKCPKCGGENPYNEE